MNIEPHKNNSSVSINESELFEVLKNSLYVGAQDDSVKMVLSYCKAAGLDPMMKPVHIVPMYCATGQKDHKGYDIKAMRDVVMPGIGLYRIQADRTQQYAGADEPQFGDDITEELGGVKVTYPKWCRITVKRKLPDGTIAEFTAKEFWKENYATKGRDSQAPNAMWLKRPYGQIQKCAEAQALRKAFPEVGSQPTADEMEGKEIDITPQSEVPKVSEKKLNTLSDEGFEKRYEMWKKNLIDNNETVENLLSFIQTKYELTEEQIDQINSLKEFENANAQS